MYDVYNSLIRLTIGLSAASGVQNVGNHLHPLTFNVICCVCLFLVAMVCHLTS